LPVSVALHREGGPFSLDSRDVYERRKVYWELMEYDPTQALLIAIIKNAGAKLWPSMGSEQPPRGHHIPTARFIDACMVSSKCWNRWSIFKFNLP
jgi:hypothetical protein